MRTADIYTSGGMGKYRIDVCWKNYPENWSGKSGISGKHHECRLTDDLGMELGKVKYNTLKGMITPCYDIFIKGHKEMEVRKKLSLDFGFEFGKTPYRLIDDGDGEKWKICLNDCIKAELEVLSSEGKEIHYFLKAEEDSRILGVCICMAVDLSLRVLVH